VQKYQARPCLTTWRSRASKVFQRSHTPESLARPVPVVVGRARWCHPLLLLLLQGWHGLWWHDHAKVLAAFLVIFLTYSPWVALWNILVIYFLGLKLVLGYK